jgi:outer membrane receptor protein involved in Fe transport
LGSVAGAIPIGLTTAPASAETVEEMVITGSRIPRPDFVSNSPVASVGEKEINLQQPVDVEAVLRGLPQFDSGNNSSIGNGSSGTSTVDLRGLGQNRTLVLIDGKRIVGFDPNGIVDITAIPSSMVKRVDVVTGGASAVYGSDAMAGIVNFILRDDFSGVRLDASHGITDHGDGERNSYDLTIGTNFADSRGNIVLEFGYLDQQQILQGQRSIGKFALDSDTGNQGGSSNAIPTVIDSFSDRYQVDPLSVTGFQEADVNGNIYAPFNFNPQNLFQAPQKRWNGIANAVYRISDDIQAYGRLLFSNSTVETVIGSTATFGFPGDVPANNPFLSTAQANFLCNDNLGHAVCLPGDVMTIGLRRRFTELGPRQSIIATTRLT